MATIALGIGTSHGPMLSTPPDLWHLRVQADQRNPELFYRGAPHAFADLAELRKQERLDEEITPEKKAQRHASCQAAIAKLAETFAAARIDVAVVVGDDQEELFLHDNMPAFNVFWGASFENLPPSAEEMATMDPGLAIAVAGHAPPERVTLLAEPALGAHLAEFLTAAHFDVSTSRELPMPGGHQHGIPHAVGFVHRRVMNDQAVPIVPVFINTFYPPNQPTIARCYDFGSALGRAILSWELDARVAVVASGGLTHFVIEEDLDREVLDAIGRNDRKALEAIPSNRFESGNSEFRNWIAVGAALAISRLTMQLVDYLPLYRSAAGTGMAAGFALWS